MTTLMEMLKAAAKPGLTDAQSRRVAHNVDRQMAARMFAAEYLRTFDHVKAYRAIRPEAKDSRHAGRWGRMWLANRTVSAIVSGVIGEALSRESVHIQALVSRAAEHADSDLFDYIANDGDGEPNYDFSKLTPAQRRAVRSIETHPGKAGGGIKKIILVDSQKALDQLAMLTELMQKLGVDEGDKIPVALTRALKAVPLREAKILQLLPPSRVGKIIESEKRKA